ncbi:NAD(P)H-dependent oxidoreductase [Vallitalea pronyensis]|uniref:NAD(P)H-dependent oxidoreductase n=1 Tax=Vallitalea pronyensis TaxID=1348613 RepID=A0A8J8SFG5_9FIRM|nr:NAD(P)H-dependent oxidoreductase [Vallitalea pronyensis]QUI21327.1 NAD(P)H-dependent oxidoreductase [Vallitalea pronyensis]
METIILNGSPRGNNGNSEIFIRQFLKGMRTHCDVKYMNKENPEELASHVKKYDTIIMVLPLYIHSMPGMVMRFIEHLEPSAVHSKQAIGFILQCGFTESSQCKYVERYFSCLAKELNRTYLGTVIKGEAAGVYMLPKFMTKKLFTLLNQLGEMYDQTHTFDRRVMEKLQQPYVLTGFTLKFMQFTTKLGANKIMWHRFLKKNDAFHKKLDQPFA